MGDGFDMMGYDTSTSHSRHPTRSRRGRSGGIAFSDEELDAIRQEIGKDGITVQQYIGLGEMNPSQLWEATMDPQTRNNATGDNRGCNCGRSHVHDTDLVTSPVHWMP